MAALRTFFILINLKTLVVAALSVLATWLCHDRGITADFPLTLIAIAIVFPVVFSIGGAYKRREEALRHYASIKAHGRSIYLAARDWPEAADPARVAGFREALGEAMYAARELFMAPVDEMESKELRVYTAFSRLSGLVQGLRDTGLASGEVSRCNQYLSKLMVSFESMKHIYQYRTPKSLRTYSDVFILLLPAIYGPYFAGIEVASSAWLMYLLPVLFSVILVSLDNIQAHLENPFDQVGEDDIRISVERFVQRLEQLEARPAG